MSVPTTDCSHYWRLYCICLSVSLTANLHHTLTLYHFPNLFGEAPESNLNSESGFSESLITYLYLTVAFTKKKKKKQVNQGLVLTACHRLWLYRLTWRGESGGSNPAQSLLTRLGQTHRPERRGPCFMLLQAPHVWETLVEPTADSVQISIPAASVMLQSYYQGSESWPKHRLFYSNRSTSNVVCSLFYLQM